MEKTRKRLLSFALALAMVLSWFPGNFLRAEAAAQTGLYGDSTEWSVWSGEAIPQTGEHRYKLTADVDLAEIGAVYIPAGVTVVIDLCGYRILAREGSRSFYVEGKLIIQDSAAARSGQIVGSTVDATGGNIFVNGTSGVLELYSGTITGGSAGTRGGNVYVIGGTFHMYGGAVTGGSATDYGGNIYVTGSGNANMYGGTVTGGESKHGGNVVLMYSDLTLSGGEISGGNATYGGNIMVTGSGGKSPCLTVTGGTVTDGSATTGSSIYTDGLTSAGTAATVRISGGTLAGETYLRTAASCTLSGAPVIGDLYLGSGVLVTPAGLTEGASITVRTASADKVISGAVKDAASCLPYFRAAETGCGVGVSNNTLVITEGCPCGCGAAASAVSWTDLNTYLEGVADDKQGYIEENGHYYLSGPLDLTGIPTLEIYADVILDLRGNTITPEAGHRTVYVNINCSLSLYDTVGGGKLVGSQISSQGGAVFVSTDASLKLYSGTITGGSATRGGNIYVSGGTFYMYGGTVSDGTADNSLGTASTNGRGGNIFSWDDVHISGGTVTGGTAVNGSSFGGNIYISGTAATLFVSGSARITRGSAKSGGNIYMMYANADISGGTVSNGTATNSGSNLYASGTSSGGYSTLTVSGGSFTGGDICLSGGTASDATAKYPDYRTAVRISGGKLKGETYAAAVQSLVLTGAPEIGKLRLNTGILVTPEGLTQGASVTVQAADTVITGPLENGADCAKYFHTADAGSTVAAMDGVLQITDGCPCGCDTAMEQINWQDWYGGAVTASGHYRLMDSATMRDTVTVAAGLDVVIDLYGKTLTAPTGARGFRISGRLSILDSIGGGQLVGSTVADHGGNIYLEKGAVLDMYSGTVTGGTGVRGGNIYNQYATFNLHGGTVSAGQVLTDGSLTSDNRGGNIYVEGGTFCMYGGTVTGGNGNRGGNICSTGTVRIFGGEITNGYASWGGGNIFSTGLNSPVYISGGTVTGGNGNGIYMMYSTLYISGGTVKDKLNLGRSAPGNYSALYISGGTLSGDLATGGSSYGGEKHVVVISGGSLTGATNISWADPVVLSGAPTIKALTLAEGVLVTPVELAADGAITLTDATGVFTTELEDAESYKNILQYSGSKTYTVHNGALALFSITSSGTCGDSLTWTLTDTGVLIISGTGAMTDFYRYNAYLNNVPWDNDRAKITSVVIEPGVTSIGSNAFYDCYNLTGITIPDTVTGIGDYAFRDCAALTQITLPEALTSLGSNVFYGCAALESITIPDGVTAIGASAFRGCTGLREVTIPDSVTSIGAYAFYNCTSLTDVYYSGTRTQWDAISVSGNNTSLTELAAAGGVHYSYVTGDVSGGNVNWKLTGDNKLTIYGTGAMGNYYCDTANTQFVGTPWREYADRITAVEICSGVTTVGDWAFYGLKALTSVTIADSVTRIGEHAFRGCSALTEITIPTSVTKIGANAFHGCTGLTTVNGCGGAEKLGAYAFYDCGGLTAFNVPAGLTAMGEHAFDGCTGLTAFTVAAGNTAYAADESGVLYSADMTVLYRAPGGITGSYTVPEGVTTVKSGAFTGCGKLTAVAVADSVTAVEAAAFDSCGALETVRLGTGTASIGSNAFASCGSLTAITVAAENAAFASDEAGALYNKDMTTLVQVPGGVTGSYQVAQTVTTVGESAFAYNKVISEVTLPSSVTAVGKWAFSCSESLTKITLPTGVKTVALGVFEHTGLTDVYYLGEASQWAAVSVKEHNEPLLKATVYCLQVDKGTSGNVTWVLTTDGVLTLSGTGDMRDYTAYNMPWYAHREMITKVVIEAGITSVGSNAFYGCAAVTELTVPAGITAIGANALSGCAGLENVYYSSSRTQWSKIALGEGNEQLSAATVHYALVEPVSITVKTPAVKTEYYLNDTLDTTGLELTVLYDDGSAQVISEGFAVSYDFTVAGTRTVTISYLEMETTCTVTVIPGGQCGETLTWLFDEETGALRVTGTGAMTDYTAESPAPWSIYAERITSLVVDEGITAIGTNAFCDCAGLTDVFYGGTARQWTAVTVAGGNDPLTAATLHCAVLVGDVNGDGVITGEDAIKILWYVADPTVSLELKAADANGDGVITGEDAIKILWYVADQSVPLG